MSWWAAWASIVASNVIATSVDLPLYASAYKDGLYLGCELPEPNGRRASRGADYPPFLTPPSATWAKEGLVA